MDYLKIFFRILIASILTRTRYTRTKSLFIDRLTAWSERNGRS